MIEKNKFHLYMVGGGTLFVGGKWPGGFETIVRTPQNQFLEWEVGFILFIRFDSI